MAFHQEARTHVYAGDAHLEGGDQPGDLGSSAIMSCRSARTALQLDGALQDARCIDGPGGERSVTDAIQDAGYNSSGHFYEASTATLGVTPTRFRKGRCPLRLRLGR